MSTDTQNTVNKSEVFGRVKWFHRQLGYGFITTIFPPGQEDVSPQDIFVHHNAIRSEEESYKYLVPGEYVQFNLVGTLNSTYEVQADEVRGIYSGKLICDVHNEQKKHTSTLNSSARPHHPRHTSYKRESRDTSSAYDRHNERERDRGDRDYDLRDNDRERDRDRVRGGDHQQEPYSRSRYTYTTPRSQYNLLPEHRVHPEYTYDDSKTPRSVRRQQP